MTPLLMATVLVLGADDAKGAAPKIDGNWRIVYAEEGGRRNNTWEQQMAAVEDNTLRFESEGKKTALKLSFGPHQTVKAKGEGAGEGDMGGVYILGQDYLCLSLNSSGDKGRGDSSGSFILILRKQRKGAKSP